MQAARDTIEYRIARERDDNLYAALARQYEAAGAELAAVGDAFRQEAAQPTASARQPEEQADTALALLDDVLRITADPAARAEVNPLLKRLGLRIGFTFQPDIKGKKRIVQRLASGRMVIGDGSLPVPLFGKDNVDEGGHGCGGPLPDQITPTKKCYDGPAKPSSGESVRSTAASEIIDQNRRKEKQNVGAGTVPVPPADRGDQAPSNRLNNSSQPEGISITKVSRGDRI